MHHEQSAFEVNAPPTIKLCGFTLTGWRAKTHAGDKSSYSFYQDFSNSSNFFSGQKFVRKKLMFFLSSASKFVNFFAYSLIGVVQNIYHSFPYSSSIWFFFFFCRKATVRLLRPSKNNFLKIFFIFEKCVSTGTSHTERWINKQNTNRSGCEMLTRIRRMVKLRNFRNLRICWILQNLSEFLKIWKFTNLLELIGLDEKLNFY